MATDTTWLRTYYGKDFEDLDPEVVFQSDHFAIVRLTGAKRKSFTAIGFVLVKRNGRHGVTGHDSLFEGMPSMADMQEMRKKLAEAEEKFKS